MKIFIYIFMYFVALYMFFMAFFSICFIYKQLKEKKQPKDIKYILLLYFYSLVSNAFAAWLVFWCANLKIFN